MRRVLTVNNLICVSLMRRFENHEVYFLNGSLGILAPHHEVLSDPTTTSGLRGSGILS